MDAPMILSRLSASARRLARLRGETLISSSTARVSAGADAEGKEVSEEKLIERVGFLASLTTNVAQRAVCKRWDKAQLEGFFDGEFASFASAAWEECFGRLTSPRKDVYMPSRALRIAQARAGETLRSTEHSYRIITALLIGSDVPKGSDAVSVRNAHRAIRNEIGRRKAFAHAHGEAPSKASMKKLIPANFFEVRPEASELSADVVRLDPTDAQLAYWRPGQSSSQAILCVKLPTRARPSSRRHWVWHSLIVNLPISARRALARGAILAKPSLHLKDDRLLIHVATEELAPELKRESEDARPFLSLDWGERRLLTGSICWLNADGTLHTTGRPLFFDSKALQGKLFRLRENANRLQTKITHMDKLLAGHPDPELQAKRDLREQERIRIWARYSNLSGQLSHACSRWATEMARLYGCQGVLTEDLSSLEARFRAHRGATGAKRRAVNARINHQVRGKVYENLRHKLRQHGLSFDSGHARGTSSYCPRCRGAIKHQRASNDPRSGRGWMRCKGCGHSADRDHASTECIASRCLSPRPEGAKLSRDKLCAGDLPVRRSRKARLARRRRAASPSSSCSRAGRVSVGRCVRPEESVKRKYSPGRAPRRQLQRSFAVSVKSPLATPSPHPARALQGMHRGFTGQLSFTPTNLPYRSTRTGNPPGSCAAARRGRKAKDLEPA